MKQYGGVGKNQRFSYTEELSFKFQSDRKIVFNNTGT